MAVGSRAGHQVRTWTGTSSADPDTDTRYDYDPLGRLDAVRAVARNGEAITPEVTDYVYDLLGNLDQVRLPNDVVSDYDYDSLNRLELLRQFHDENDNHTYESSVDALLAEFDYDLLADGRRSGVTETDDQDNTTRIDWLYDDVGRLVGEAYNSYDDDLDFITGYEFDLAGNRLEKASDTAPASGDFTAFLSSGTLTPDETVTYTYDDNDRLLTEVKDATGTADDRYTEYEYGEDNSGTQQTAKTVHEGLTSSGDVVAETTYAYNLQGRMSQTLLDEDGDSVDEKKVEYEYDDDGIRVSQTVTEDTDHDGSFADETPVQTKYLIDRQNPTGYAQVLEEKSAAGALLKSYTLGLDVISQALAAGAVRFLLYDGHGSTRGLVDATGQPLSGQVYRYDAYGNPLGFDPAQALTTLLYSGEWLDRLTNLQYLRARYYDSSSGRFTRLDPFSGTLSEPRSLHKYLYAQGDAVNGIDPSGLWTIGGVLATCTIITTVGSILLPVLGAAYLSARGKISFMKVVDLLGKGETWRKAGVGVIIGAGVSIAIQAGLLKLGKEMAKKITPGVGLLFAIIGLGESVRLTYKMVTEELPPDEAEEYIAILIAGSVMSSLLGWKARQWARQARNDTSYWNMTLEDQQAYNTGQTLLPSRIYNRLASRTPVSRGKVLERKFGDAQRFCLGVQGFVESVINFGRPGRFNTWSWLSSGLTPELRFVLGENYFAVVSTIAAMFHLSTDVRHTVGN